MPETITVRTSMTRQQLTGELRNLPAYLSGRLYDSRGLAKTFRAEFAYHLFNKISRSFFAKSSGGSDEFGNRWKPLKPATIVQRASRHLPKTGRRGLLSVQQEKLWKRVFAQNFARLAPRMGEKAAKQHAAKMAWGVAKSKGAKTLKERFAGARALINWVSGRLKKSLMPGRRSAGGYQPPSAEQVYEEYHGFLLLGTAVPYAPHVHRRRRLWPSVNQMGPWITEASQKAMGAVIRRLTRE